MKELCIRIKKSIIENPLHFLVIILSCVLAYGFYAVNYTINIDLLVDDYYNGTTLVTAGRWSAFLIHQFTNWMNFSPFWHTTLAVIIMITAVYAWGELFRKVSNENISEFAILGFRLVFVTFPVIEAQITFPILNIVLSYLLIPIVIWLLLDTKKGCRLKNSVIAIFALTVSVDAYESFAAVYLVGLFGVYILQYVKCKQGNIPYYIKNAVKMIAILFLSIVLDYIISKAMCLAVSGSTEFWYNNNTKIYWAEYGLIDTAIWLIRTLIANYLLASPTVLFVFLFDFALFAGFITFLIKSIKDKSVLPILLFSALSISSIALSFIVGIASAYTQSQTFSVYAAFITLIIIELCKDKKYIKPIIAVLLFIVVLNQTKSINNYSVDNYEKYKYEETMIRQAGQELTENYDINKPVVFIVPEDYSIPATLQTEKTNEHYAVKIYKKVFYACADKILPTKYYKSMGGFYGIGNCNAEKLAEYERLSLNAYYTYLSWASSYDNHFRETDIYLALERYGYSFKSCDKNTYEEALKLQKSNNPKEFYEIIDSEDFIVVQFMKTQN